MGVFDRLVNLGKGMVATRKRGDRLIHPEVDTPLTRRPVPTREPLPAAPAEAAPEEELPEIKPMKRTL